jgi:hypothetical protein
MTADMPDQNTPPEKPANESSDSTKSRVEKIMAANPDMSDFVRKFRDTFGSDVKLIRLEGAGDVLESRFYREFFPSTHRNR